MDPSMHVKPQVSLTLYPTIRPLCCTGRSPSLSPTSSSSSSAALDSLPKEPVQVLTPNRDNSGEAEEEEELPPRARTPPPPNQPKGGASPRLKTINECCSPPQHSPTILPSPTLHPPATQGPVGGRLQRFWRQWKDRGAHPWVVGVLRWGYIIQFNTEPTLVHYPTVESGYQDQTMNTFLLEAVQKLIEKDAIEEIYKHDSPGYYSRLFLTPKASGGWRPIIDLKPLNPSVIGAKTKQETQAQIRSSLRQGQWAISVDLADAFFHVPIHPTSRKYLRFSIHGRLFQYKALPFGVSVHVPTEALSVPC